MKDGKNKKISRVSAKYITRGALVGGLYVTLTLVSSVFGLSSGAVQFRLSEALCVLPAFMPEAIVGLYIGCIIANLISGCMFWDIILGSLATLIGAAGAYLIGKQGRKFAPLVPLPTVAANMLIVPLILMLTYGIDAGYGVLMIGVGVGEFLSAWLLGSILYSYLSKSKAL